MPLSHHTVYCLRATASKLSMYFSIFRNWLLTKLIQTLQNANESAVYPGSTNMAANAIAKHCGPIRKMVYAGSSIGKLKTGACGTSLLSHAVFPKTNIAW